MSTVIKEISAKEELKTIKFHREVVLKRPTQENLLTLDDADEYKLSATNMLLKKIAEFSSELQAVGLKLQQSKWDKYPKENLYLLIDTEYGEDSYDYFHIRVKSDWLNLKEFHPALHAGFELHLYVIEDGYKGRGEFADWINIGIVYFNTVPTSFASRREHVLCLRGNFFKDLPMNFKEVAGCSRLEDGYTFKTAAYVEAVDDVCRVLQKIILRKQYLKVVPET